MRALLLVALALAIAPPAGALLPDAPAAPGLPAPPEAALPVLVLPGSGASPQGQAQSVTSCGGMSPVTSACSKLLAAGPGTVWLAADAGTGFKGTVVATLVDADGDHMSWACSYLLFVGPLTQPSCTASGSGELNAPGLRLLGAATDSTGAAVGYWEVKAIVA